MLDELLVSAGQRELARSRAHAAAVRALDAKPSGRPAARSLQYVLHDLYGARRPSADPALFGRLVWAGLADA